jgi:hypothetical protein
MVAVPASRALMESVSGPLSAAVTSVVSQRL